MNPIGLYVHVPFCVKKCPYCDFYSLPFDEALADRYLTALLREMESRRGVLADTLYLGGGTPVLLGEKRLVQILKKAQDCFSFSGEATVEANPGAVSPGLLAALREAGYNRLSFGMQSAVGEELGSLGRIHSAQDAAKAVRWAKQAGFSEISVDVMLGIKGQTSQSLANTLAFVEELQVPHVSAYLLKIEPGTPYACAHMERQVPDEDQAADLYLQAVRELAAMGLQQYEISNFARPGHESRHNLKYWRCQEYLGFGPAAHSYFGGKRFCHPRDLTEYLASNGGTIEVTDDAPGGFEETAMLGLRLAEGVDMPALCARFGREIDPILDAAKPLLQAGLLTLREGRVALTPEGFLLSNAVIGKLVLQD